MAEFKTGYLQHIDIVDLNVKGAVLTGTAVTSTNRKTAIMKGDFVKVVPATSTVPKHIVKATEAEVTAQSATHIVALTDQTIGGAHINVERKDYTISDVVGAIQSTAPAAGAATKRVGLWPIKDWNDVTQDADKLDALT